MSKNTNVFSNTENSTIIQFDAAETDTFVSDSMERRQNILP